MEIRLLSDADFEKLYHSFLLAFSENQVKFKPTREEFEYRLYHKLMYSDEISACSFDGDEMTGFILHTSGIYQGIPTAYNGGTGVLPGFRNQKIAEQLYEFLIPMIRQHFLARILLEVIENNERAIALYEKIGFSAKRRFLCYKMTEEFKSTSAFLVVEGDISEVNFTFNDFEPSFIDSSEHLKSGKELVLLAKEDEKVLGYLILQPHLGRISQLAVGRIHRQRGVGEALLKAAQKRTNKQLAIMNIPEDELGFDAFLRRCGFKNQVNQFEMELII